MSSAISLSGFDTSGAAFSTTLTTSGSASWNHPLSFHFPNISKNLEAREAREVTASMARLKTWRRCFSNLLS